MRIVSVLILTMFLMVIGLGSVRAQYGEHGKPRMLLIQTHTDVAPPNDDESDKIRQLISQTSIAKEVKMEDFMTQKLAYTVIIKEITPIAMPDGFYDDLKERIRKTFPRATFQEIEFDTAYKWLGKSPFSN